MTTRSLGAVLGAKVSTVSGKSDTRKKLIMAVRAAARRLQLDDEDRKAIQLDLTGKASMADMDAREIGKLLDHLNRGQSGGYGSSSAFARSPHAAKVKALWWTCYWLGEIDSPADAALDAFVKRQTGLSSIRFLNHLSAPPVIEALKAIAARAGVMWPRHSANSGVHDRRAVIDAIYAELFKRSIVRMKSAWAYLGYLNIAHGSERELDICIRTLGKKLRRAMDKPVDEAG